MPLEDHVGELLPNPRLILLDLCPRAIGRAVIEDDELDVRVGLRKQTTEVLVEIMRVVVRGREDRYEGAHFSLEAAHETAGVSRVARAQSSTCRPGSPSRWPRLRLRV